MLGLVVWRDGRGSIEKPIELGFHFSVYFVVCTHLLYKNNKNRIELMCCPHTSLVAYSAAFFPSLTCQ